MMDITMTKWESPNPCTDTGNWFVQQCLPTGEIIAVLGPFETAEEAELFLPAAISMTVVLSGGTEPRVEFSVARPPEPFPPGGWLNGFFGLGPSGEREGLEVTLAALSNLFNVGEDGGEPHD